jgi:hypothetical protein
MNEIEDDKIVKEWQIFIPFIKLGMKHPCAQFTDNTSMSYADDPYFRKQPRIDE